MPLPKRLIEPNYVARSGYARGDNDHLTDTTELETVTNTTLTNIIRQLSSLSKHSENIFAELAHAAGHLAEHTNSLQARIDRLAVKVTQLDSTIEEVSLQDVQLKKAFKSATLFDQQIFSRATMPAPMLETYQQCDKPPPLDILNCYRDDGKDGLKFYTDPNYFFELWRQEMLKDTERVMHDRGKKTGHGRRDGGSESNGHVSGGGGGGGQGTAITASGGSSAGGQRNKKRPRAPQNTLKMQVDKSIHNGETVNYQPPNSVYNNQHSAQQRAARPDSIGQLQLSYPPEAVDGGHSIYAPGNMISGTGGGVHYMPAPQSTYGATSTVDGAYPAAGSTGYDEMAANGNGPNAANSGIYTSQQQLYGTAGAGQGPGGQEAIYSPGTPGRTKVRPSHPPPAPPPGPGGAGGGSGQGTPSASTANTPTRSRSMSTGRDALPPPPPVPEMMMQHQQQPIYSPGGQQPIYNGGQMHHQQQQQAQQTGSTAVAAMLLARTNSQSSRSGSPLLGQHGVGGVGGVGSAGGAAGGAHHAALLLAQQQQQQQLPAHHQHHLQAQLDQNAQVVAQLNSQINSLAHMHLNQQHHHQMHQQGQLSDLPPPPPNPEYISPRQSPPSAMAPPPPPPPPPPMLDNNGVGPMGAGLPNNGLITPQKLQKVQKKLLPPIDDTRNDLMNAIRSGITLRKVEKSEAKENERNVGLTDVASILARRVAIELSGTDSDSDSDDDSEGWAEHSNETFA